MKVGNSRINAAFKVVDILYSIIDPMSTNPGNAPTITPEYEAPCKFTPESRKAP